MIYDNIKNFEKYFPQNSIFYNAINYVKHFDISLADGEYEIDGRNLYAKVVSYTTNPFTENRFESHIDYIDIQILLEGQEIIYTGYIDDFVPINKYDKINDVINYEHPKYKTSLFIDTSKFVVLYPHDVHCPNCNAGGRNKARKICVKVRV